MDHSDRRRGPAKPRPARVENDNRMWDAADVSDYLKVSRSWVYQHAEVGLLPVIRLPGSAVLRFDPAMIKSYARGEWKPPLKIA